NKKIELNNLENNLEIKTIENQIELLEINNEKINNELNELKNNFNFKNNLELEKIKNKYKSILSEEEFLPKNNLNNLEKINYEIEKIQNELNQNKIELHKLKLDRENIEPRLNELSKIEEDLELNRNNKEDLEKLNTSMEITKNILEEAYEEMKNSVTPKFTNNLSQIISVITNNKYNKIKFNDENGIIVELENGDYVETNNLSIGTIEQLYLSLRISMIDELSEEKLPLFLDETFAYYDEERLRNVLMFLIKESRRRQVFIFTCSKREIDALKSLNINCNIVEL
ncbi:MAG: hypothetical protein J6I85_00540, partial [Clostridia bacterium]|nr:hypothetical protein [Clostridia bacterium]